MNWNKVGKIFDVSDYDKAFKYSSVPFLKPKSDYIVEVFFTTRDKFNRSTLMSFDFDLKSKEVVFFDCKPLLSSGDLGCFDDSGVMGTDYLKVGAREWIYYIGWNLGVTVPFRNSLGLAERADNGEWGRLFPGPILDRTKDEPHFNASACVINEDGIYKIWYLSCTKWEVVETETRHHYHIKYATSNNGIDWDREGVVAIDFESPHEYAISVPRVLKIKGRYHMWFSSRATEECDAYQIRHAISDDGIKWDRTDEPVLLPSFDESWDGDMVCYPFVYQYHNKLFMFYNGNKYGGSGIGLAEIVLEDI